MPMRATDDMLEPECDADSFGLLFEPLDFLDLWLLIDLELLIELIYLFNSTLTQNIHQTIWNSLAR